MLLNQIEFLCKNSISNKSNKIPKYLIAFKNILKQEENN